VARRRISDKIIQMKIKMVASAMQAVVLCLALVMWASPGFPQTVADPAEIMAKVQGKYDQAGTFKSWFRQETRQTGTTQGDRASGVMYFQKPSRMRWQYESPPDQKKEVISDGSQVWIYIPDDAIAMVYPLRQMLRSDLVLRFFSGIGEVTKDFRLAWQRPPEAGSNYVIKLEPRQPQPELKRLILTVNPQTYLVENLEFSNSLGEETSFAFSRTTLGLKQPPNFFTFTPPPGVQIVREGPGAR
jgi:outer membrane lipoprotein carrier protein